MKDKAFARAVTREDLERGAEELGLPLEEHVANVIDFLRARGRTRSGSRETSDARIPYN